MLIVLFAVPVFVFVALSADVAAAIARPGQPRAAAHGGGRRCSAGPWPPWSPSLVAYYGTIAAYRLGLDPDNYGIPLVTSSMDLVGAFALILAIVVVGHRAVDFAEALPWTTDHEI